MEVLDHSYRKFKEELGNEPLNFTMIPKCERFAPQCRHKHQGDMHRFVQHCDDLKRWVGKHGKLSDVTDINEVHYLRLREEDYINVWRSEWTETKSSNPADFWRMHQQRRHVKGKPVGSHVIGTFRSQYDGPYMHCLGWMTFSKFEHRKHPFRYHYNTETHKEQTGREDGTFLFDTLASNSELIIIDQHMLGVYCDGNPENEVIRSGPRD